MFPVRRLWLVMLVMAAALPAWGDDAAKRRLAERAAADARARAQLQQAINAQLQQRAQQQAVQEKERAARIAELQARIAQAEAVLKRTVALQQQGAATKEAVAKAAADVAALQRQLAAVRGGQPAKKADPDSPDAGSADNSTAPDAPIDPELIRLRMADGTVITGKLNVDAISIDTKFGELTVPVTKIRRFRPGLDSQPQRRQQITKWIEQLGSENEPDRKAAAAALIKAGPALRRVLAPYAKNANAHRADEAKKILERYDELDEFDEFDESSEDVLTNQDMIVTTEFTVLGAIVEKQFKLQSDFGELSMNLGDIRLAERNTGEAEVIRRKFRITETNLAPRAFKKVGLAVKKGDKITVAAKGTLAMTRWGSNAFSTPDGAPNYGWYLSGKVPNGALCAKIGNSGQVFKVGSKYKAVAKSSGVIYFGIGMTDRYARTSYRYPGTYDVHIEIERE